MRSLHTARATSTGKSDISPLLQRSKSPSHDGLLVHRGWAVESVSGFLWTVPCCEPCQSQCRICNDARSASHHAASVSKPAAGSTNAATMSAGQRAGGPRHVRTRVVPPQVIRQSSRSGKHCARLTSPTVVCMPHITPTLHHLLPVPAGLAYASAGSLQCLQRSATSMQLVPARAFGLMQQLCTCNYEIQFTGGGS